MSANEVLIFFVLIAIGFACGVPFGCSASRKGKELHYATVRAVFLAVFITFLIIFSFSIRESVSSFRNILPAIGQSFVISIFYGFYPSILTGVSALISSWIAFRATGPD